MNGRKILLLLLVILGWFALTAQLYLHLENRTTGIISSLSQFFRFFTILTNLLVTVMVTANLTASEKSNNAFFLKPSVITAITIYITLVGVVYNLLLRSLWSSSGLQAVLHDILHTAIPLLTLVYWFIWVNTREVNFNSIPKWTIYPAGYCLLVLILGYFTDWYPYPFFNIGQLGLAHVLKNGILLLVTFWIFSFVILFIGKKKNYFQ